jgi:hypothetical protein
MNTDENEHIKPNNEFIEQNPDIVEEGVDNDMDANLLNTEIIVDLEQLKRKESNAEILRESEIIAERNNDLILTQVEVDPTEEQKPLDNTQIATDEIAEAISNLQFDDIIDNLKETKTPIQSSPLNMPFEIEDNKTTNEVNYTDIFNSGLYSSPVLNKNDQILRRSSFVLSELKEDTQHLQNKKIISNNESYLKPEDFTFNEGELIELEKSFRDVELKYLDKRADIYKLYETIKNCNLYKEIDLQMTDYIPNIGPVSTLEYMVESTFGFDRNLKHDIIEHILSLEKHIFRWRSILGDGNCYFRAIMFGWLENILLEKNALMIKQLIVDMVKKFDESYYNTRILPQSIKNEIKGLNIALATKILYLIFEILENNSDVLQAYEVLIKSFNYCTPFDNVYTCLTFRR